MIRIALHPRDPQHALLGQKENIRELKEQGYTIVSHKDLITDIYDYLIVWITQFLLLLRKA
ncbi:MAG: hypothetical protein WA364_25825 [Candidatus Nitrosopolaris sp.]